MSDNNKILDGTEQWIYLIRRFRMNPTEALAIMESHGQNIAEVLIYLETILESYTLNNKKGKSL
tara:strand:- start:310 stop:501 length:192 start_codon:yes stop_codon:yes gene_type:complete